MKHIDWLVDTGTELTCKDGKKIKVLEFRHRPDAAVLTAWAAHFRGHYCSDDEIDLLREGTGHSRSSYLTALKFPDIKNPPGPSIRAGDFAEILVADYLEFTEKYWVPRTRYADKDVRNESSKGSDVVGIWLERGHDTPAKNDRLAVFEAKAQFSGKKAEPRLQEAVDGSSKDKETRVGETLNAIKQRYVRAKQFAEARKVQRFQDPVSRPYVEVFGAVAMFVDEAYDVKEIEKTDISKHAAKDCVVLIVVKGAAMMALVHALYKRAADEA